MKESVWSNNVLWFRVAAIAVFVWLVISTTTSLILYFTWGQHHHELAIFVLEFSLLFFILPAVAIFGLINSIPLIAQWLSSSIPNEESEPILKAPEEINTSYRSMAEQLEEAE